MEPGLSHGLAEQNETSHGQRECAGREVEKVGSTGEIGSACESWRPHESAGAWSPMPRYVKVASVAITAPTWSVASTSTGPMVFGTTWETRMRQVGRPSDSEAVTKLRARTEIVEVRITRIAVGQEKAISTSETAHTLRVSIELSTRTAPKRSGTETMISESRESTVSTHPPK